MGSPARCAGRRQASRRACGGGVAEEGRRPCRPHPRPGRRTSAGCRAGLAGPVHGAGPTGQRDRARRDERPGRRATAVPVASVVSEPRLGQHPQTRPGGHRRTGRSPHRAGPRRDTPPGVDVDSSAARGVSLDIGVRPATGRLVRPRPRRHRRDLHQRQGRSGGHVQGHLGASSAGGVGGQHPRVRGDAAAAG